MPAKTFELAEEIMVAQSGRSFRAGIVVGRRCLRLFCGWQC